MSYNKYNKLLHYGGIMMIPGSFFGIGFMTWLFLSNGGDVPVGVAFGIPTFGPSILLLKFIEYGIYHYVLTKRFHRFLNKPKGTVFKYLKKSKNILLGVGIPSLLTGVTLELLRKYFRYSKKLTLF